MPIVGAQKQEQKLDELAKVIKDEFNDVDKIAIKGALRYGAQSVLEKSEYSDWEAVAKEPATIRKQFFDDLLEEARGHLEGAVGDANIEEVIEKMKQVNNDRYL